MSKFLTFISFLLISVHAFSMDFFENKKIDYWKKEEVKKKEVEKKKENKKKFSWKKHLNPENDEFFKEGNHKPPDALMEVSRRPTDENIKNYLKYIGLKNFIKNRTQQAIESYIAKNNVPHKSKAKIRKKLNKTLSSFKDTKEVKITLFYRSDCSACHKMHNTLSELHDDGFIIEARQLDSAELKVRRKYPVQYATPKDRQELKKRNVKAVPYTLITFFNGGVYSLNRPVTKQEFLTLISNKK